MNLFSLDGFSPAASRSPRRNCRRQSARNGAAPARTPKTCADRDGPCYVYLLQHKNELRFKIGVAADTRTRADQLPEAGAINFAHSFLVRHPSRKRAVQIERMLHKALAGFNRLIEVGTAGPWDGATEWFATEGLSHALNLLRIVPKGSENEPASPLLDMKGKPVLGDALLRLMDRDTSDLRRARVADVNVEVMYRIAHRLSELSMHVSMQWHSGPGQPDRLRVRNIRQQWTMFLMQVRLEIMSEDFWWLYTGQPPGPKERISLVTLIRYRPDQPDTLEFQLQDPALIRKLPGGGFVLGMWRDLCASLHER